MGWMGGGIKKCGLLVWVAMGLAACGGGGGGGGGSPAGASAPQAPTSRALENICTVAGEKNFTHAYLDENYLWYGEIPQIDASVYTSVNSYFYDLLVTTPDSNGLPKDQFSFVVDTVDADSMASGVNVGYGVQWKLDELQRQRVAFVTAGSPAAQAGMARGGQLVEMLASNVNSWYPNTPGAWRQFLYSDTPNGMARSITLFASTVQEDPVPLVSTVTTPLGTQAGYLLFNDHSAGAQDKLITVIQSVHAAGLHELVLDMRYNTGGYLYVTAALASMLSGPQANGQVVEALRFNDKRTAEEPSSIFRFEAQVEYSEGIYPVGYPFPRLGLQRLYVLTSGDTCSASESLVNGLRGIDVQVILVGETTCGKPYGFNRKNNCGRAYYPIEFQGVNAKGFGNYSAGFAPTCAASDDLGHALGQVQEGLLASALHHIDSGACAPASSTWALKAQSRGTAPSLLLSEPRRIPHGRLLRPASP